LQKSKGSIIFASRKTLNHTTMKIADLYSHILSHYANNADNYPTNIDSNEVFQELGYVDKLIAHLVEQEDDTIETEDGITFVDESILRYDVLKRDFTSPELCELLEEVYICPCCPALDIWIEDVKDKVYFYAPKPFK
jgi:hypothetical protein